MLHPREKTYGHLTFLCNFSKVLILKQKKGVFHVFSILHLILKCPRHYKESNKKRLQQEVYISPFLSKCETFENRFNKKSMMFASVSFNPKTIFRQTVKDFECNAKIYDLKVYCFSSFGRGRTLLPAIRWLRRRS